MSDKKDIRWLQRFSNYNKALDKLSRAIDYIKKEFPTNMEELESCDSSELILNDIIKQGLIQNFEFTHELAWNVMKDYALYQGNSEVGGSRDATREALTLNIIKEGKTWMEMIVSRNQTSHTYNAKTANEIYLKIINEYYNLFVSFQKKMEEKRSGKQQNIFE